MIFYKKLVPFFSALVIGAMMELLIAYPLNWYIFLIVIALVVLVTVYYLNSYKFDKAFLGFAITPLLFAISGYLMIFFLETSYVEQIVIGVIFLGLLIYWGNVVTYLWDKARYTMSAMENVSSSINLLASFFLFVSTFNFFILNFIRLRYLIFFIFIVVFALSWQTFWVNNIENKSKKYFPLIFTLIFIELFWVLHYLPISYLVTGIIMTVVFYAITNVTRYHLLDLLQKKIIYRYATISIIVVVVALLTASWT